MTDEKNSFLDMLNKALTMEKRGMAFYEEALSTCSNDLGRDIFKILKNDEVTHIERIEEIYASLSEGKEWSNEWKSFKLKHGDLNGFFEGLAKRHGEDIRVDTGDLEALDVGIDFELKAVSFYEGHLEDAKDPLIREFIERMITEERSHHKILEDMKFYITDPAAWFMEQERGGLDGA